MLKVQQHLYLVSKLDWTRDYLHLISSLSKVFELGFLLKRNSSQLSEQVLEKTDGIISMPHIELKPSGMCFI